MEVVDALLRVALVALTSFPGEESAQRVAAKMLLPALTRRRALCRACVASRSWAAVADDGDAMRVASLTFAFTGCRRGADDDQAFLGDKLARVAIWTPAFAVGA